MYGWLTILFVLLYLFFFFFFFNEGWGGLWEGESWFLSTLFEHSANFLPDCVAQGGHIATKAGYFLLMLNLIRLWHVLPGGPCACFLPVNNIKLNFKD